MLHPYTVPEPFKMHKEHGVDGRIDRARREVSRRSPRGVTREGEGWSGAEIESSQRKRERDRERPGGR